MPGDGVRTSPVHGWLGYCWLISFWGVMSLYFQTVVMLGMLFPMFLFVLNVCILTVLSDYFIISILLFHLFAMPYYLLHTISYILSLCLIDNKLLS